MNHNLTHKAEKEPHPSKDQTGAGSTTTPQDPAHLPLRESTAPTFRERKRSQGRGIDKRRNWSKQASWNDEGDVADRQANGPVLRFTPYAWAKLLWFRDQGDTEIGGFGVASCEDPLLIEDFVTVKQACSMVTVEFDDQSVADFVDDQVDVGRKPAQFLRVWLHTHPGESAHPSSTDEATFFRVFGSCDWSVMAILAKGGQAYARLRFGVGPGAAIEIPVEVDFGSPFPAADHLTWEAEFTANVTRQAERLPSAAMTSAGDGHALLNSDPTVADMLDELNLMEAMREMDPFNDHFDPLEQFGSLMAAANHQQERTTHDVSLR